MRDCFAATPAIWIRKSGEICSGAPATSSSCGSGHTQAESNALETSNLAARLHRTSKGTMRRGPTAPRCVPRSLLTTRTYTSRLDASDRVRVPRGASVVRRRARPCRARPRGRRAIHVLYIAGERARARRRSMSIGGCVPTRLPADHVREQIRVVS